MSEAPSRIVVIGARGLIGSFLCRLLADSGSRVRAYDSERAIPANEWDEAALTFRYALLEHPNINYLRADPLARVADFRDDMRDFQPSVIVNLGGESLAKRFRDFRQVEHEDVTRLNYLLALCALEEHAHYCFASSSMVYGNFEANPQDECFSGRPVDIYGALKLGSELFLSALGWQEPSFMYSIVRPSAVYGPFDINRRVVTALIEQFQSTGTSKISDAQHLLDFTFVADVAVMIARIVRAKGEGGTFNVTNGHAYSLGDLRKCIQEEFPGARIVVESSDDDIRRPMRGALAMTAFDNAYGTHPQRPLKDGVEQLIRIERMGLADPHSAVRAILSLVAGPTFRA